MKLVLSKKSLKKSKNSHVSFSYLLNGGESLPCALDNRELRLAMKHVKCALCDIYWSITITFSNENEKFWHLNRCHLMLLLADWFVRNNVDDTIIFI